MQLRQWHLFVHEAITQKIEAPDMRGEQGRGGSEGNRREGKLTFLQV